MSIDNYKTTSADLASESVFADNRFNRFDDELIDKYFNDEGKKAIQAYTDSKVREAVIEEKQQWCDWLENYLEVKKSLDK